MKKLLTISLVAACAFMSCNKTTTAGPTTPKTTNDIVVPTGFNWENSRNVSFVVNITDAKFAGKVHVICVYDGDPANGGKLMLKGSATTSSAYKSTVYLSDQVADIYIACTAPDNVSVIQKATISASNAVSATLAN